MMRFNYILNLIVRGITPNELPRGGGAPRVSPAERLTVTQRFLATGETFRSLNFQFHISRKAISSIVWSVCRVIVVHLKPLLLSVPLWNGYALPKDLILDGISLTLLVHWTEIMLPSKIRAMLDLIILIIKNVTRSFGWHWWAQIMNVYSFKLEPRGDAAIVGCGEIQFSREKLKICCLVYRNRVNCRVETFLHQS